MCDLAGRLIEETNANGQVIADYIYLGKWPLAMVAPAAGQEQIYFYHNDHLGTPGYMTDQSKNVVWTGSFDPFGNVVSVSGSITNNLRFSGQYFDKETGLNYNGNRYYDPGIGRYLRPDPIGLLGGMNRYVYVQNNPVNLIDPTGLWAAVLSGTLMGVDISRTVYDSNLGWWPGSGPQSSVSTTLIGLGVQIFPSNSPIKPCQSSEKDVNVSLGILSKYLGATYNTDLSRYSINLGLGLGLPVSFSTSTQNFAEGISDRVNSALNPSPTSK